MANLAHARRRLTWTFIGLALLDVAALVILLSPLVVSSKAQQAEEKELHTKVQAKMHEVIAPDRVQFRVAEARKQIDGFYKDRVPAEFSAIWDELGKVAAENKVSLSTAKSDREETGIGDLHRVTIDATLVGNYLQEVKFINALERDRIFFLVDSVTLGEQTGGSVRLEVKLETYLKGQV